MSLRKQLIIARGAISDRYELSKIITEKADKLVFGNVMVYVSIESEVDTHELIQRLCARKDVNVFVPYTVDGKIFPRLLKKLGNANRYGNLPEECYVKNTKVDNIFDGSAKIDCCITPLLGFNDEGHRIGYGKGCYDRFFMSSSAYRIGLAFDCQRVSFKSEVTDIPLDCCVSEKDVIYFRYAGNLGKI